MRLIEEALIINITVLMSTGLLQIKLICLLVLMSLSLVSDAFAQLEISVVPEVSQSSFYLPVDIGLEHSYLSFSQRTSIIHLDHPLPAYYLQSYSRRNITMVTEISSLKYKTDYHVVELGRDYVSSGPSQISAPLFSAYSPSLDQVAYHFNSLQRINYEYRIIRLNNRQHATGTFNRWLYYRRLSIRLNKSLSLGLKEAVLATGIQRGVDFRYLNPAAIFQLEQLHNNAREKIDGPNNDNQFIGFDLEYSINKDTRIYSDIIIDEFQIDIADRDSVQDVFGITAGFYKQQEGQVVILEYWLASPWLYTNGGMFTNVEIQNKTLGLIAPHSHGFSVLFNQQLSECRLSFRLSIYQTDDQSVTTRWDSRGNRIPLYNFDGRWKPEFDLSIHFDKSQYLDHIRLTYDLLNTQGVYLMAGLRLINY